MLASRALPVLAIALAALAAVPASASHLTTLYAFCRESGCADGAQPFGLVIDAAGNILGTTAMGGANGEGVVYQLEPPASGHKWRKKVLHDFCSKPNCVDGAKPESALTPDTKGNFFGATDGDAVEGKGDNGTVFELSPDTGHSGWNYRAIYNFCSLANCADGERGNGTMAIDTAGNVYGVTAAGGANGQGVVYELSPVPGRKRWAEKVLYSFCAAANCSDGANPVNGLTYAGAASGAPYDGTSPLYGTASSGGTGGGNQDGVVFSLTPGSGGTWNEQVIYDFCSAKTDCSDGAVPVPQGALALDAAGDIYGATYYGGKNGSGVLYQLHFGKGKWREKVLYDFCALPGCADGSGNANVIVDSTGTIFGTSDTTAFRLVPDGRHSRFKVLHQFCTAGGCDDGFGPDTGVIMDASGDLFGSTTSRGAHDGGTVFELKP
jgi:uncharacterized repeat protein (TIGR03803 family)